MAQIRANGGCLDATEKDPIAEKWLARDAEHWLEPVGELRRK
jgi:hypothetical protein